MPPLAGACLTWLLLLLPLAAAGLYAVLTCLSGLPFLLQVLAVSLPSLLVLLSAAFLLARRFSKAEALPKSSRAGILALL